MRLSIGIQGFIEGWREPDKTWTDRNFAGGHRRYDRIQQWEQGARLGTGARKVLRSRVMWVVAGLIVFAIVSSYVIDRKMDDCTLSYVKDIGRAYTCD